MTTEFFALMNPPTVTHHAKNLGLRAGKPIMYDSDELKAVRQKLMAHIGKHVPIRRYDCGVRLTVKWLFPRGKTHKDGEYRVTKPDTDNLQKALKDVMTRLGFWKDDALVASEVIEKFWAEIPGIYIRIEEL